MGLLDQFRGAADRLRGVSIAEQSWIDIDGVSDTGQLLRAIEALMPRDARLNVMRPSETEAETLLRKHAMAESRPEDGDFFLATSGAAIAELARLADRIAPAALCSGIFVVQGDRNVLESYRRDAGEDVVWLSADLDEELIARFREALSAAGAREESREQAVA